MNSLKILQTKINLQGQHSDPASFGEAGGKGFNPGSLDKREKVKQYKVWVNNQEFSV